MNLLSDKLSLSSNGGERLHQSRNRDFFEKPPELDCEQVSQLTLRNQEKEAFSAL